MILYVHMASENCRDRAQYREALLRMASLESQRAGLLQDESPNESTISGVANVYTQ